mmetsp:Transcript_60974/g.163546  ORF Transcript_60974/g.163546 Transcript_60974/m.163546 type:complete len:229 (+) Transcript_60974:169-855(+)
MAPRAAAHMPALQVVPSRSIHSEWKLSPLKRRPLVGQLGNRKVLWWMRRLKEDSTGLSRLILKGRIIRAITAICTIRRKNHVKKTAILHCQQLMQIAKSGRQLVSDRIRPEHSVHRACRPHGLPVVQRVLHFRRCQIVNVVRSHLHLSEQQSPEHRHMRMIVERNTGSAWNHKYTQRQRRAFQDVLKENRVSASAARYIGGRHSKAFSRHTVQQGSHRISDMLGWEWS